MINKKLFLILSITCMSFITLKAQEYDHVDSLITLYPTSFSNLQDLADQINQDFSNPKEKARAIYSWISFNIDYDTDKESLQKKFRYSTEEQRIELENKIRKGWAEKTIRKGAAECEGYATLYKCLCDLVFIECVVIPGNTKTSRTQIGLSDLEVNHAWNAIKTDSLWEFVDVTWGAGYLDFETKTFYPLYDPTYFLTPPEKFYLNHFPQDTNFLFVDKTAEEFINLPLFYSEYINADIYITQPEDGILHIVDDSKLTFQFRAESNPSKIYYQYDDDQFLLSSRVYKKGDYYEFTLPAPIEENKFLTLFVDNKEIATYKIE